MTKAELYSEIQTRLDDPSGERYTSSVLDEYLANCIKQLLSQDNINKDDIFGLIKEQEYDAIAIADYIGVLDLELVDDDDYYSFIEPVGGVSGSDALSVKVISLPDITMNITYGLAPYYPEVHIANKDENTMRVHYFKESGTISITALYVGTPYIPRAGSTGLTDELDDYYSYRFQVMLADLMVNKVRGELADERGA